MIFTCRCAWWKVDHVWYPLVLWACKLKRIKHQSVRASKASLFLVLFLFVVVVVVVVVVVCFKCCYGSFLLLFLFCSVVVDFVSFSVFFPWGESRVLFEHAANNCSVFREIILSRYVGKGTPWSAHPAGQLFQLRAYIPFILFYF